MTDLAALARADLNACFDLFERSAFRLETLPAYAVGGAEEERLNAFRSVYLGPSARYGRVRGWRALRGPRPPGSPGGVSASSAGPSPNTSVTS